MHASRVCPALNDLRIPELAVPPSTIHKAAHRNRYMDLSAHVVTSALLINLALDIVPNMQAMHAATQHSV